MDNLSLPKQTPIAILSHWHTGSRLLLRILHACGMELGNNSCGYTCPAGEIRENWGLCTITNEMHLAQEFGNPYYNKDYHHSQYRKNHVENFDRFLKSYNEEATKHGWHFFGFKNVHLVHDSVWKYLGLLLLENFPDVKIITSLRHPIDIMKSTSNDPTWNIERILKYYKESFHTTKYLLSERGAQVIMFPDSYKEPYRIKEVVAKLGLTWTGEAERIFDESRIKNISTEAEKEEFATTYPEAHSTFGNLRALCGEEV